MHPLKKYEVKKYPFKVFSALLISFFIALIIAFVSVRFFTQPAIYMYSEEDKESLVAFEKELHVNTSIRKNAQLSQIQLKELFVQRKQYEYGVEHKIYIVVISLGFAILVTVLLYLLYKSTVCKNLWLYENYFVYEKTYYQLIDVQQYSFSEESITLKINHHKAPLNLHFKSEEAAMSFLDYIDTQSFQRN